MRTREDAVSKGTILIADYDWSLGDPEMRAFRYRSVHWVPAFAGRQLEGTPRRHPRGGGGPDHISAGLVA
jgi:hypothetical protein